MRVIGQPGNRVPRFFEQVARPAVVGAVVLLLRGYQHVASPMFAALGSQCRFEPSCSQYMIDAVRARGVVVGVGLGVWRLMRCNPFGRGGYDPAPPSAVAVQNVSQVRDVSRETI